MARIVCVGEGMLELSQAGGQWQLGHGGDTLNTALHLARAGCDVAYLTAVGADPLSEEMKGRWAVEGLDTSMVLTHPTRQAGLYAISTDENGERSFTYWRETSAAREMFGLASAAVAMNDCRGAELLYFSLISLAILSAEDRRLLFGLAALVRANGGRVAFDGNYRARLWSSPGSAREVRDTAIQVASIGLPTLEDEIAMAGDPTAEAVSAHWIGLGCEETVVKLGAEGCLLPDGSIVAPEQSLQPVDTSGAGDAFNAGYLAARLAAKSPEEAARAGHQLAGWTIMRRGAIPPRDENYPIS